MLFSSVPFLLYFLPLFLFCYIILPFRNATALIFSFLFYAWGEGYFVFVLVFSVVLNYFFGQGLVRATTESGRKRMLWIGVSLNLTLLAYFKYFGFLAQDVLGWQNFTDQDIPHLPLGISFFTFQSISYLVDVYRHKARPARSFWDLAIYIMMFPQLIAGPIVRYASVARQIQRRTIHLNYVRQGLLFFSIGLAQKVLVANNMAVVADGIFALPLSSISSALAWTGAGAYTLQIFYDFCGYSNMAIGQGLFMGFRFPHNFNYPYISKSITEFWRRWHMSLSSWFRDYVYIPLGGNRLGPVKTFRNLFLVFFLCGLWHGAAWTFVAWGIYHGSLLIIERSSWGGVLRKMPSPFGHLYAMLGVIIGWVLFRAESFEQAQRFLEQMFFVAGTHPTVHGVSEFVGYQQIFFALVGVIAATPLVRAVMNRFATGPDLRFKRLWPGVGGFKGLIDTAVAASLVVFSLLSIASGTYNPFIYFRF